MLLLFEAELLDEHRRSEDTQSRMCMWRERLYRARLEGSARPYEALRGLFPRNFLERREERDRLPANSPKASNGTCIIDSILLSQGITTAPPVQTQNSLPSRCEGAFCRWSLEYPMAGGSACQGDGWTSDPSPEPEHTKSNSLP